MDEQEKELYVLRCGYKADSERGRAAIAWLSGDTYSPSSMGRSLGIKRSNASTARATLEALGLTFAPAIDPENKREHLFTLVEPVTGMSSADMARRVMEAWVEDNGVLIETADGAQYTVQFDGGTMPKVKRTKRAAKK